MKRLFAAALIAFVCSTGQAQLLETVVEQGKVSGVRAGKVAVYRGIPFAAPPIGSLRWAPPQPPVPWVGVRSCDRFAASPVQNKPAPFSMWTEEFIAPPEPLSEDCLYLNIWTAAASAGEKRPALVWIYGGGFVSGSGACAVYDGEAMAARGIVHVTINYRVGVFGFMAHPELSKEAGTSGNYAIQDQIAALQWIGKNIAAFGGDPDNITIAGQSAGSFSVNALLSSPLAKGLFHRAIAQSGGLMKSTRLRSLTEAEKTGTQVASLSGNKSIGELRNLSSDEIQSLSGKLPYGSFAPVLDGTVLPTDIIAHYRSGKNNSVPVMTGWVTGDAALTQRGQVTAAGFRESATQRFGDRAPLFLQLFPASSDEEARRSQSLQSLIDFAVVQSHLMSTLNQAPAYVYQFSFVPTDKPGFPNYGAFHTSEVPFALHTLARWNRPWQSRDLTMESMMSSYWINFIRTGNPNGPGLPIWSPYGAKDAVVLELGEEVKPRPGLYKKEIEFLLDQ